MTGSQIVLIVVAKKKWMLVAVLGVANTLILSIFNQRLY